MDYYSVLTNLICRDCHLVTTCTREKCKAVDMATKSIIEIILDAKLEVVRAIEREYSERKIMELRDVGFASGQAGDDAFRNGQIYDGWVVNSILARFKKSLWGDTVINLINDRLKKSSGEGSRAV